MSDSKLQFLKKMVAADPDNIELLHRYIAALQRMKPINPSSCNISMLDMLENCLDASTTLDVQTGEAHSEEDIRHNSCLERAIFHLKSGNFFEASIDLIRWIALDWGVVDDLEDDG